MAETGRGVSTGMIVWMAVYFSVLIWSATDPHDRFTWLLETLPAMIGFAVLVFTYRVFPLTRLLYVLILLHCIILMVGGHYTYAEVPLFDWISGMTGSERNNFDKLGHFAQGFVPAMITREIVIRRNIVNGAFWQAFFAVSFSLAFSAFYELVEWWVALAAGEDADAFLGTQGYVWDTQSDMGFALLGALLAVILLRRMHDRELALLHSDQE